MSKNDDLLKYDKRIIKIFLPVVWVLVIIIPFLLVTVNFIQYFSFKDTVEDENRNYFTNLNQLYSTEILSLEELDSIKKNLIMDTTIVFDSRMTKRFENLEEEIIRHAFLVDSVNQTNLELFEGKIDTLNMSIDTFNKKVSNMYEVEMNFNLRSNIFYSIVMLIIALAAFLGYRSLVNIKSSAKDDAIDVARKTSKDIIIDDIRVTIMDLLREKDFISEFNSDIEKTMDDKLEGFRSSLESEVISSDSARIDILEEKINSILQKIKNT